MHTVLGKRVSEDFADDGTMEKKHAFEVCVLIPYQTNQTIPVWLYIYSEK